MDIVQWVQAHYPGALAYGLTGRVETDRSYIDFGDTLCELYYANRPTVALCTAGIVIRSLASSSQRRGAEPSVLVLAENGSTVVPPFGGLVGVNRLVREIGEALAAIPATATGGELRFGVCVLNPPAGYVLADLEQSKHLVADSPGDRPVRVEGTTGRLDVARSPHDLAAALVIHVMSSTRASRAEELLIHLRCVLVALEPVDAAADAVRQMLVDAGLTAAALGGLLADSTWMVDPCLQATADTPDTPLCFLSQADLAARLRQALPAAEQVDDRLAMATAPLVIDRIGQCRNRLTAIGLGPGYAELTVLAMRWVLGEAEDILSCQTCVDMAGSFRTGQVLHGSNNREKLQYARHASELTTTDRAVVLVSFGDPDVSAMVTVVLETLHSVDEPTWGVVELWIFPGVPTALATMARAGVPLGHDFRPLSLSDNLKPWEVTERCLGLVGAADLVTALYNPILRTWSWQLRRVLEIVIYHRLPQTLVVLGCGIGRPGERPLRTTLGELRAEQVDMRTPVIIGSSTIRSLPRTGGGA